MKNTLRLSLALALSALPVASALACGGAGDFTSLEAVQYAVRYRRSLSPKMSLRALREHVAHSRMSKEVRSPAM